MDKDVIIDRYEQLRAQAMGKLFTGGKGLGLALFMRQGMTAWIYAWSKRSPKIKFAKSPDSNFKNNFSNEISHQVTIALTNMIMSLNRKETEDGFSSKQESHKQSFAAQSISVHPSILNTSGANEPGKWQTPICPETAGDRIGLAQGKHYCY
jgi:hypothetical protein